MRPAKVARLERLDVEAVGEEAARQWRPDDHAEAALERERQDLVLDVAHEVAVLVLERRDRADRERALDLLGAMVRQTAVPDLSLGDELEDGAPRLLDRHGRIAVVRLQEIDLLAAEPAQARLDVGAD